MRRSPPPNWKGEHVHPVHIRWRNHLLINTWQDMLAILQDGTKALDPRTLVMNFAVLPMGVIFGGFAVGAVRWALECLLFYLPIWCVYAVGLVIVLGGPDLLPPLTLMNGCEELIHRIIWTSIVAGWYYFINENNAYKYIMIVSAIWHIDRGDYNYKKFQYVCYPRQHIALSEENISNTIANFSVCFLRSAAGFGMLWAAFGVHTAGQFCTALLTYAGINIFIYFCIGEEQSFIAANDVRGRR